MKIIEQNSLSECGVCVINMLANEFHRNHINKNQILKDIYLPENGLSILELEEYAMIYGVNMESYEMDLKEFKSYETKKYFVLLLKNPDGLHYVVAKKKHQELIIYDSVEGVINTTVNEISSKYCNIIILCKKGKPIEINFDNDNSWWKYINYKYFAISILFQMIVITLTLLGGTFMKNIIDMAITDESLNNLVIIAIIYSFVFVLNHLAEWILNLYGNYETRRLYMIMFNMFIRRIENKEFNFYDKTPIAQTMQLSAYMQKLSHFFAVDITQLVSNIFLIIVAVIILSISSIWFILITIVATFGYLAIAIYAYGFNKSRLKIILNNNEKSFSHLNEFLMLTKKNQNHALNNKSLSMIKSDNYTNYQLYKKNVDVSQNNNFITNGLDSLVYVFIVVIGSFLIIKGDVNYNVAVLTYAVALNNMINQSIDGIFGFVININDIKQANEIYHKHIKVNNCNYLPGVHFTKIKSITFSKLNYGYNKQQQIIKNLNMNIVSDTLINGPSGSGKSTLMKILTRRIKVANNTVYIDDVDINFLDSYDIRQNIIYHSSAANIIDFNISDLIQSHDDKLRIKIISLIKLMQVNLNATNFDNLSSGQKQIISLLQLLLYKNKIILLDEPLSHVDPEIKLWIIREIKPILLENNFIIWVSHDASIIPFFEQHQEVMHGN